MTSTPENVRLREEAAARCTAKIKRRGLKKQESQSRASCEMLLRATEEEGQQKAVNRTTCERAVH